MAKCHVCSRTRCVCERGKDTDMAFGPPATNLTLEAELAMMASPRRATVRARVPRPMGVLSYKTHHGGCVAGCQWCTAVRPDPSMAYVKAMFGKEVLNKFESVDDGVVED